MSRAWPLVELGDILDGVPRNGVSPATEGVVEEKVLTLSSITGAAFDEMAAKVGRFKVSPSKAHRVNASDLLVCRGNGNLGLVGRGYFPKRDRADLVFPDTIIAVRVGKDSVHPSYLEHVWNSSAVRTQIERQARTTNGTYKVNQKILQGITFPLPPIDEQRRIAGVLDQVNVLRTKRRAAIALLDDLAQSIFLDMFGDPFRNPRGWPVHPLGNFFSIKPNYGTMIPGSGDGGDFLCLRVANIQNWNIDLRDRKYVDLDAKSYGRHVVVDGDLLMARAIASQEHLGKAIIARPGAEKWAFDSHLMRLRFDRSYLLPEYVQAFLRSEGGRRLFLKASRRSAVQFNINTREMSALHVPLPPIGRQEAFVEKLDSVGKARRRSTQGLAEMDDLFGSLQQRAFRGELWED